MTTEQIHERAKRIVPEISLGTVYNTLKELVAMKEVRELHAGPTLYDPNIDPTHHHLECLSCGEILDVHVSGAEALRPEETYAFKWWSAL